MNFDQRKRTRTFVDAERTGAETPQSDSIPTDAKEQTPTDPNAAERAERAARAKDRASSSTERVRRFRERKKNEATETAKTSEPPSDLEVLECGSVFSLIYDLALVPVTNGRLGPLTEDQSHRAGRVLVPLVKKYAPMLGDYQSEIAAALVLGSIFRDNWRNAPNEDEAISAEGEGSR